jgi:hypothetical protein
MALGDNYIERIKAEIFNTDQVLRQPMIRSALYCGVALGPSPVPDGDRAGCSNGNGSTSKNK